VACLGEVFCGGTTKAKTHAQHYFIRLDPYWALSSPTPYNNLGQGLPWRFPLPSETTCESLLRVRWQTI